MTTLEPNHTELEPQAGTFCRERLCRQRSVVILMLDGNSDRMIAPSSSIVNGFRAKPP
jgi:hypothetical protein